MEEFILKFYLVNSCSLSRKHEYKWSGRFSDFPGFAKPSRLVVSGMELQAFPAGYRNGITATGIVPDFHRIPSHHQQNAS